MSSITTRCVKGGLLVLALATLAITLLISFYALFESVINHRKTYKIAFVNYAGRTAVDEGFENYLRRKGIRHKIIYYAANRDPKKITEISNELAIRTDIDLVVTWGTTVTLGVFGNIKKPTAVDGPGVFVLVTSPLGSRIVHSLEKPGRNITGSWHVAPVSNQLRSMLAYKPTKKIGVIYTPSEENSLIAVKELKRQANIIGIEVIAIPFDFQNGLPVSGNSISALAELKARGCEWLYLPPDSFLGSQAKNLVIPEAHRLGIMTFASTEQLLLSGAVAGLVAPYITLGELTGVKAEQILVHRKKPTSIPVSTVARFSHIVNEELATKFGVDMTNPLFSEVIRIP